ncbi:nucleophosmin 1b [Osmerus mordax]|uniref:nucleophosmin 1b n=1 Tax=Osmerus mordax TaxID=8014 RepID=UPI00350FF2D9
MAEDNIPDLSRPQIYLFGCTLKSDKKEFRVEVEDVDADHQLSLKAVCLGADADDQFHTVEIEGVTYDGKTARVPLAVLKPSVLPSLSLGGFEITPPVTFRLQSGGGPVYISGQHFVSVRDSEEEEEEEENNSSPVKRPSSLASGKRPAPKKMKMESDDDDDDDDDSEEDDDDDDDEDSDEEEKGVKMQKNTAKPVKKSTEPLGKKPKGPSKQNGSPGTPGSAATPQAKKMGLAKQKSGAGPSGILSLPEVKSKLTTAAKEGKPLPKTEQKFENFAKSSFRITDKKVVKDLWGFVQTLKTEKK